ncbi:protein LKAAEAR1-like isoform X1 [Rhopilema esculentum]|uniref:protein LKAAEAR1-like isoform X1 n=1 Tax=Rhopilema esculentum TaxID=499914 RepID=UPI0031E175C9
MAERKDSSRGGKKNKSYDNDETKLHARNWKQLSKKEVQKLHPQLRSKYLAYEEPSKDAMHGINASRKRIADVKKEMKRIYAPPPTQELMEAQRHEQLIGQLKAAEARNRARLLRLRYEKNRADEVNHLISCQPTAIKAMRLQTLLPAYPKAIEVRDILGKDERMRIENLLADEKGLETGRILK